MKGVQAARMAALILAVVLFAACTNGLPDGQETTPGGSTPDASTASGTDSTSQTRSDAATTETDPATNPPTAWPADLLPEGFPEMQRSEIYYAGIRSDGKLSIQTFGTTDDYNQNRAILLEYGFIEGSLKSGLINGDFNPGKHPIGTALFKKNGLVVFHCFADEEKVNQPGYEPYDHLEEMLMEHGSPTGQIHEILCWYDDVHPSIFLDFPAPDTPLGLQTYTFSEWPAPYLPDGFPPPPEELSYKIKQLENGVFLTVEGDAMIQRDYLLALQNTHLYRQVAEFPSVYTHANPNADYFHYSFTYIEDPNNPSLLHRVMFLQIVRYEDAKAHITEKE